ncbi:hypothetical protein HanPSC8_Chr15g0656151 [Helianthus annuus]|nr:hypothetical protein HanPSC8_Chr15g0656151 [Helianthus annuus]
MDNERSRSTHPNKRRKSASPMDFHGTLPDVSPEKSNLGSNVLLPSSSTARRV